MNELMAFDHPEFGTIRMTEIDGEAWFVGKDITDALGYQNASKAIADHVDDDDKLNNDSLLSLGQRGGWLINESGMYSLILSSKLPTAKQFKHWVTSEVLPSIRKHGGYIQNQKEMTTEELMAKALEVAHKVLAERDIRISQLTVENQIMAPKAEYFDAVVDRNLLTNFRTTAKELGVKEKTFINFLLDKKFVYRDAKGHLQPKAGKGDGLFEVKEWVNTATQYTGTQTLITPRGKETFRLLLQGVSDQ